MVQFIWITTLSEYNYVTGTGVIRDTNTWLCQVTNGAAEQYCHSLLCGQIISHPFLEKNDVLYIFSACALDFQVSYLYYMHTIVQEKYLLAPTSVGKV